MGEKSLLCDPGSELRLRRERQKKIEGNKWGANKQTTKQTNRQTHKQTNQQTHKQTVPELDIYVDEPINAFFVVYLVDKRAIFVLELPSYGPHCAAAPNISMEL